MQNTTPDLAARVAAEIRAEATRQGRTLTSIAKTLGESDRWMTRRFGRTPSVPATLPDVQDVCGVLNIAPAEIFDRAAKQVAR